MKAEDGKAGEKVGEEKEEGENRGKEKEDGKGEKNGEEGKKRKEKESEDAEEDPGVVGEPEYGMESIPGNGPTLFAPTAIPTLPSTLDAIQWRLKCGKLPLVVRRSRSQRLTPPRHPGFRHLFLSTRGRKGHHWRQMSP